MASKSSSEVPPAPSAAAASKNPSTKNKKRRTITSGMDVWLQSTGKDLGVGQHIRLQLVKGAALQKASSDPVDKKAPPEQFPLIAKFPVSTVTPDFESQYKKARLYQQDIPKPLDSDDDDDNEKETTKTKKQRWKYNNNKAPPRQWVLQNEVEFLETMMARRKQQQTKKQQATSPKIDTPASSSSSSSRYEGIPEHNPSHYVLFQLQQQETAPAVVVMVRNLPTPHGTVTFQQPESRSAALTSLSQAEQAIQDQRAGIIHPRRIQPNNAAAAAAVQAFGVGQQLKQNNNSTKNRLLQKLQKVAADTNTIEEGDDVMADVAFRERKGSSAARKELLDFADGLAVSHDGVLGGSNDAAFAGRGQRFGNFHASAAASTAASTTTQQQERGADGAAMEEDFYTRDVQAEYEELDYDANEQFDDDDVDLGETEVGIAASGFGEAEGGNEDEDDLDDDEDALDEDQLKGAEGLATVAGFKELLAKARGEIVVAAAPETVAVADASAAAQQQQRGSPRLLPEKKKEEEEEQRTPDHISKIMAAAEKSTTIKAPPAAAAASAKKPAATTAEPAIQTDENGLRILTLEAVRREIWLNHNKIPSSRLIKIFAAKKKFGADRPAKFKAIVKELCTMKQDPVEGAVLVLKQHYAHMD